MPKNSRSDTGVLSRGRGSSRPAARAKRCAAIALGLLAVLAAGIGWAAEPDAGLHVGLRRSSYGQKNGSHAWWAKRAKQFAAQFPVATPVIIEIVSGYQNNGSTCS